MSTLGNEDNHVQYWTCSDWSTKTLKNSGLPPHQHLVVLEVTFLTYVSLTSAIGGTVGRRPFTVGWTIFLEDIS
jgi:hypothetical protein